MEAGAIRAGGAAVGHADHHEHHGPPPANRSSRVDPQLLGMMLFIISEVMVFGAFFTAYFFIRVVNGDAWPAEGTELPVAVAGVNTCILISSSFTLHWAETSIKHGNRAGLRAGIVATFLLGLTFLFIQVNEYVHIGFAPARHRPGLGLLRPDGAARRARVHRPDPAGHRHDPGLPRALHARVAPGHRGAGHLLALRRRDVDRRVHDGLHPLSRGRVQAPWRSEDAAFAWVLRVAAVAAVVIAVVLVLRALT